MTDDGASGQPADLQLSDGARLFIWGIRHLMAAMLQRRCVPDGVLRAFAIVGGAPIYYRSASLLLLAARDADRPLLIQPPCSHTLSADEESLSRALGEQPSSPSGLRYWQALLGRHPSGSLQRCARALAHVFATAGVPIGVV